MLHGLTEEGRRNGRLPRAGNKRSPRCRERGVLYLAAGAPVGGRTSLATMATASVQCSTRWAFPAFENRKSVAWSDAARAEMKKVLRQHQGNRPETFRIGLGLVAEDAAIERGTWQVEVAMAAYEAVLRADPVILEPILLLEILLTRCRSLVPGAA